MGRVQGLSFRSLRLAHSGRQSAPHFALSTRCIAHRSMLTRGQRRSRRHSADRCHGVGRWWRRSTADQAHCVEPFSRATIDPGRDLARGTYLMILGLQYRRATDKNWNYWLGLDSGGAVKDRRRACWRVLVRDRQSTAEMDVVHNDRIRTLCGYVEAKHGGSIPRTPQLHWASSRAAGKTAPCAD